MLSVKLRWGCAPLRSARFLHHGRLSEMSPGQKRECLQFFRHLPTAPRSLIEEVFRWARRCLVEQAIAHFRKKVVGKNFIVLIFRLAKFCSEPTYSWPTWCPSISWCWSTWAWPPVWSPERCSGSNWRTSCTPRWSSFPSRWAWRESRSPRSRPEREEGSGRCVGSAQSFSFTRWVLGRQADRAVRTAAEASKIISFLPNVITEPCVRVSRTSNSDCLDPRHSRPNAQERKHVSVGSLFSVNYGLGDTLKVVRYQTMFPITIIPNFMGALPRVLVPKQKGNNLDHPMSPPGQWTPRGPVL